MIRPLQGLYRISQKLREIIDAYKIPMGGPGKDWLVKALHPSDPMTEIVGIPDQSTMSTACLNWQVQPVIAPASGAVGTWSADITLWPDPAMPLRWAVTDSVGTRADCQYTSQLGGTYVDAFNALTSNAERWRLAYLGATLYVDAPALSDQGSIVAAQVPIEGEVVSCAVLSGSLNMGSARAMRFQASDVPSFGSLVQMPNAYTSQAKFGAYMPLRLGANHQRWFSQADTVNDATGWPVSGHGYTIPSAGSDAGAVACGWPYTSGVSAYLNTTLPAIWGMRRFYPINENVGHICLTNLSVSTRITVVVRMGLEVQCCPNSIWAPMLRPSPAYDREATEAYFRISRELKDAYPADYNDLGKLWDVLKDAARKALPLIGRFGGPIGQGISMAGSLLLGQKAERKLKESVPKPSQALPVQRDRPPAVEAERVRRQVSFVPDVPRTVRKGTKLRITRRA